MNSYLQTDLPGVRSLDDAVQILSDALTLHGFAVLIDIDASALIGGTTGVTMAKTRIVEAFDTRYADEFGRSEPEELTVTPCAFMLVETGKGVSITVADPSGQDAGKPNLEPASLAQQLSDHLEIALAAMGATWAFGAGDTGSAAGSAAPKSSDYLSAFSDRLEKLTMRFRASGSLTDEVEPAAPAVRHIGRNELERDMMALNKDFPDVIALLETDQHKFYAEHRYD
jgi:uncharacterized protein (DUF302 family)